MSNLAAGLDLSAYVGRQMQRVEEALEEFLPPLAAFPAVVHRAMRHSLFAGGKRLRPLLVLTTVETLEGAAESALPTACAVELIHTYSLIHDDLPSMDNASMRRGRPTCHVMFGEAVAVLAGDALHALAFDLLARTPHPVSPAVVVQVVAEIASSIGTGGMVGGQVLDLLAEARPHLPTLDGWPGERGAAVHDIHLRKTAALIRACTRAGGLLSGASPPILAALSRYGERLGLAFQIVDDVLDEVGEAARLGKGAGQDAAAAKLTYPAVHGVAHSRSAAAGLTDEAIAALSPLGPRGRRLVELARFLLDRDA